MIQDIRAAREAFAQQFNGGIMRTDEYNAALALLRATCPHSEKIPLVSNPVIQKCADCGNVFD